MTVVRDAGGGAGIGCVAVGTLPFVTIATEIKWPLMKTSVG
jgi:hypothetical protein